MSSPRRSRGSSRRKRNDQRFAEAVAAHQQGALGEAERAYLRIIESDPEHGGALHYLGLVRQRQGRLADAVALLARAALAAPRDASVHNNLGNLLRESGRAQEAVRAYRRCIALDDGHRNARFNLAMALLDAGEPQACIEAIDALISAGAADAHLWNARARAESQLGRHEAAVESFQHAVAAAPAEPALRANLIDALGRAHRIEEALDQALEARRQFPNDLRVRRALGGAYLALTRYQEAVDTLGPVLEAAPDDRQARVWYAQSSTELDRPLEAVAACDAGLERTPDAADLLLARGSALIRANRLEAAIADLGRAHALEPEWVEPLNNLGMAHADLGRMEEAEGLFRQAIARDPASPEAWFHLARSGTRDAVAEAELALLEETVARRDLAPMRRVSLNFALAHIHDARRDYARAFHFYAQANEVRRRLGRFDARRFESWVQGFHDVFTPALMERLSGAGHPSERPVFVLGLPRSGTTLVEQILASHPDVYGGDELKFMAELANGLAPAGAPEDAYPGVAAGLERADVARLAEAYLERIGAIDSSAARFTDKMPSNHFHIGLIALMFPRARIVHVVRDAMDVCFSNYIQAFASGHLYAYSLSDIAVYYREYVRLMAHWKRLLPGRIHDVGYEALLADQEAVTRDLIAHLGLPWDDACLRFHETERTVRTASHWQVRQPIYTRARARWRNYAPWLGELAKAVGYEDGRDGGGRCAGD